MPYRYKNYGASKSSQLAYNNQQIKGDITLVNATYGEEQIILPKMPEGVLPGFLRIDVQFPTLGQYMDAAGDIRGFHLSPKPQSALLEEGDPDCICTKLVENQVITAHGVMDLTLSYEWPAPQLISYTAIYIGAKTTLGTKASFSIHYVPRESAVVQRDNLISQAQF